MDLFRDINWKSSLGELVIIVIGILIAVQVDNWMTRSRNIESVQNYLVRVSTDIEGDLEIFASEIRWMAQRQQKADQLLDLIENGEKPPADSVLAEMIDLVRAGPKNRDLLRSTYLDLLNTGAFELMADEELRRAIIGYYEIFPGHVLSAVVEEYMQQEIQLLSDGLNRHFDLRYVFGDSSTREEIALIVSSWDAFVADNEVQTHLRSVSARSTDITQGLNRFSFLAMELQKLVTNAID